MGGDGFQGLAAIYMFFVLGDFDNQNLLVDESCPYLIATISFIFNCQFLVNLKFPPSKATISHLTYSAVTKS